MVFGNKKLYKNEKGEVHVGINSPKGFVECDIKEVEECLKDMKTKKIWRCHVCNDLAISAKPLETCPTCFQIDAYVEINEKEFRGLLQI